MNVEEIRAALNESHALPQGRPKSERLELLAMEAKAAEDRLLEGEVLLGLIRAYEYGGERDRMPVAFGRLLRLSDEFPAEVGRLSHPIHWQLKWMTYALVHNPAVPLATTYRWLDELESRYRQRGYSARPVLALRSGLAQNLGDDEAAATLMEASIAAPRDEMADCDACESNGRGTWRARVGDDKGALEFWAPVISGRLRCAEEPHRVLAGALLPLVRTGRIEDARSAYLKGYPLVRRNISLRPSVGYHVEFCALTGNEARGLEILTEHVPWLTDHHEDVSQRLGFVGGVAVLLRRLSALGHGELPVGDRTVEVTLAALEEEIADLCARYDARNGNTAVSERVAQRLAGEPLLDRLPLGTAAALPKSPGGAVPTPVHRSGATLEELVTEARRLSAARHPAADKAWNRVAASGAELSETVAAEVARSSANGLIGSDPGSAYDALLAVAERFTQLADAARALEARATAALATFQAGDEAAAEALALIVTAEAESAYEAGELSPGEYLAVRRAGPIIAMRVLGQQENRTQAEVNATWALVETELAAAMELGVHGRVGTYHDMLFQLSFWRDDLDSARTHLAAALTHYVEAGEPWHAARPAAMLGQLALDHDDPKAAEDFARQALDDGGSLVPREDTAQLSSLLVEAISRQPGRELDLVGAALTAATRWDGISEPDMLHNTFTAARAYHHLGRHAEAAAVFAEVMPRVEIPYDPQVIAMTRRQYGESLHALQQYREAAEQFLKAAQLVQDDPNNRFPHAELAWYAAESLQHSGQRTEALAAYQRAAELWAELGQLTPRVRCLRSVAWLLHWTHDPASEERHDGIDQPGVATMRAVLAELESLAENGASEEVLTELAETREQLDQMLAPEVEDSDEE
jgi:tetratricopeptide (TPR) repeat protein